MSYLVLARKYRPQNFSEIIDQEIIVNTIIRGINKNKIPNAYLLTGSKGVGKTSTARIIAKSLSCKNGITSNPCNTCNQCKEITNGNSIDTIEIDGASNTSVDNIRNLKENLKYQPSSNRFKVCIIDEVHMLSNSAFNALLKIIEEPSEYVRFIFATTEAEKIPKTIISRCQRYDFKKINNNKIEDYLKQILIKEKIKISNENIKILSKSSDGDIRNALGSLEQVINFSEKDISTNNICRILGISSNENVQSTTDALMSKNVLLSLKKLEETFQHGISISGFMEAITNDIRNLCIAKYSNSLREFPHFNDDEFKELKRRSLFLQKEDLHRMFSIMIKAMGELNNCEKPKLLLELYFLKMADRPQLSDMITISSAISKLELLSKNLSIENTKNIDNHEKKIISLEDNKLTINQKWQSFLEQIKKNDFILAEKLKNTNLIIKKDSTHKIKIIIESSNELNFNYIKNKLNEPIFDEAIITHFNNKNNLEIKLIKIKNEKIDNLKLEKEINNDICVKNTLKIFNGKITSIKKDNKKKI